MKRYSYYIERAINRITEGKKKNSDIVGLAEVCLSALALFLTIYFLEIKFVVPWVACTVLGYQIFRMED